MSLAPDGSVRRNLSLSDSPYAGLAPGIRLCKGKKPTAEHVARRWIDRKPPTTATRTGHQQEINNAFPQ